ncbi:MFS transporter [Frateuria aurantia]
MNPFYLLGQRRFGPFFWTQALGAFNDSAFRNALVLLATFGMGLGDRQASIYANLAPAIFILPYFLFSAQAGQWADRLDKTWIIRWVKRFEVLIMLVGSWAFATHHLGVLLFLLFLLGVHSTVFGPVKYAILPQALGRTELLAGNGLVELGTQLAILLGQIVSNVLLVASGSHPWVAGALTITVALAGYAASRAIPATASGDSALPLDWRPWRPIRPVWRVTRQNTAVFAAILGISWFWFYGTAMVAQLPDLTRQLGGDGSVQTLVLTLFSLGCGAGALICGRFAAPAATRWLVLGGALGMSVFAAGLGWGVQHRVPPSQIGDWRQFVHAAGSWRLMLGLWLIGVSTGPYVVPLFAMVQRASVTGVLSRVIAGNNIVNAVYICAASACGLLLGAAGLRASGIYLVVSVLNLLALWVLWPSLRPLVAAMERPEGEVCGLS